MAQMVSINPTRMAIYYQACNDNIVNNNQTPRVMPSNSRKPTAGMSKKAKQRLRVALNWLVSCSAKRNVQIPNGTIVSNFQVSFITLTLPTKQMHTHKEIKARCLNLFLQKLRIKFGVKNYVWKAELQKNGNIHFHLSIDKPIHYMIIRRFWNEAIAKLGYITAYAKTYIGMSFEEYCYWQRQKGHTDPIKLRKAYNFGVNSIWSNPNTTDVRSVKNVDNWASYMAKYMAKDPANKDKKGIIADSLNELVGRVWYCSTSLSALGSLKFEFTFNFQKIINKFKRSKKVLDLQFDFCRLFFFQIKSLSAELRNFLREELLTYAMKSGYCFPSRFPVW